MITKCRKMNFLGGNWSQNVKKCIFYKENTLKNVWSQKNVRTYRTTAPKNFFLKKNTAPHPRTPKKKKNTVGPHPRAFFRTVRTYVFSTPACVAPDEVKFLFSYLMVRNKIFLFVFHGAEVRYVRTS